LSKADYYNLGTTTFYSIGVSFVLILKLWNIIKFGDYVPQYHINSGNPTILKKRTVHFMAMFTEKKQCLNVNTIKTCRVYIFCY